MIALGLWVIGAAFTITAIVVIGFFVLAAAGKVIDCWHRLTRPPDAYDLLLEQRRQAELEQLQKDAKPEARHF